VIPSRVNTLDSWLVILEQLEASAIANELTVKDFSLYCAIHVSVMWHLKLTIL
jgi:hypothetical protein